MYLIFLINNVQTPLVWSTGRPQGQTQEQPWLGPPFHLPLAVGMGDHAKTDSKIVIMHNKILVINTVILKMYHKNCFALFYCLLIVYFSFSKQQLSFLYWFSWYTFSINHNAYSLWKFENVSIFSNDSLLDDKWFCDILRSTVGGFHNA